MNLNEKMKQIPFGDSQFQIVNFISNEGSPQRSYRKILLQLDKKYQAMRECSFRRKRKEIDIAEIKEKLKTAEGFEKQRLEISLEEAEYYLEHEIKLIEDCAIEIKTYETMLEKLPGFTREEFEAAELTYWQVRLLKDAKHEIGAIGTVSIGTRQALEHIGIQVTRNDKGQPVVIGSLPKQLVKDEQDLIEDNLQ